MSKPITLYAHLTGPNPWKVAIILEQLGVPYTVKMMDFRDLKKDPYEKININGRVPAIEDPNTGITLWESGAIVEYLVETYDKNNSISFANSPEKFLTKQWLHFQMSGQGPFLHYHSEKLPSAITRYENEIRRVTSVLDRHLAGKTYLVGEKLSYADLAFVPWQNIIGYIMGENAFDAAKEYPNYHAWHQRLSEVPAVKKIAADREGMKTQS